MYSHSTVNMSFVECEGIVQYELMIIICDLKIQKSSTICHTSSQANKILVLRHIVQFQKKQQVKKSFKLRSLDPTVVWEHQIGIVDGAWWHINGLLVSIHRARGYNAPSYDARISNILFL